MGLKYINSKGEESTIAGNFADNIPTGAIVEYDGTTIPEGYELYDETEDSDGNNIKSNNSVLNIVSLTNAEFTSLQSSNKLVNGTIYNIIDD
jgi:hypothetical protein